MSQISSKSVQSEKMPTLAQDIRTTGRRGNIIASDAEGQRHKTVILSVCCILDWSKYVTES